MKRARKQQQHPHPTTNRSKKNPTRSRTIHLEVTPEQLVEKGNLKEAVHLLRAHVRTTPSDEKRRLLGRCLFQLGDSREAAQVWLVIQEKTAHDLALVGVAFLHLEEWDQAELHLRASLQLEERGYRYYWLALAQQKNRDDYRLSAEERAAILDLLQKACVLPACPVEAFLWLDDLARGSDHDDERTTLLEEAFARYPDVEEVRLRFSNHLLYHLRNYEGALTAVTPLFVGSDPPQGAVACAFWASQKAGLFEKALAYSESMHSNPFHRYGPGLAKIKGDLYLAFGKIDEAVSFYEQETQSDDFTAIFLGLFSIAEARLTQQQIGRAAAAAAQGAQIWFDNPNDRQCSRVLFHEPVSIGTGADQADIGDKCLSECVKNVCVALLAEEQQIELPLKGQLSYLLYDYRANHRPDESRETRTELLLQAAQETQEMTEAIRQECHEMAWNFLQAHQDAEVIKAIFLPFYRSFWYRVLIAGDMHQEIVDVSALLLKASPDTDVDNELWDYAYSSDKLGNTGEAERANRSYLERHPDHANTLHNLALLVGEQGLLQEALALSSRVAALAPYDETIVQENSRFKRAFEEQARSRENAAEQELVYASSQERAHLGLFFPTARSGSFVLWNSTLLGIGQHCSHM